MRFVQRYYHKALNLAKESKHDKQKVAAIALRGRRVVGLAVNDPRLGHHAEHRALVTVRHKCQTADMVIVARANGLISRPCFACYLSLKSCGVRHVAYANVCGELVVDRLEDMVYDEASFFARLGSTLKAGRLL